MSGRRPRSRVVASAAFSLGVDLGFLGEPQRDQALDLVRDRVGNVSRPPVRSPLWEVHPEVLCERRFLAVEGLRRSTSRPSS